MANAAWKKLKAALGDGFTVPEPVQQMPEMDLTGTMEMPEMDISHPEEVTKTRPLAKGSKFQVPAEMRMPTMDLSKPEKVMEMPAMDLRPGAVDAGESTVSDDDIKNAALEQWMNGDHGDAFGDKPAPKVPSTETLVARPGSFGKGELISPDDPTAAMQDPVLTSMSTGQLSPGRERFGPSAPTPDRSATKALLAKAKKPAAPSPSKGSADPLDPANFPAESGLNPTLPESAISSSGNAEEGPRYADAFPPTPAEDSPGVAAVRRPLTPRPGSVQAQVGAAVTGATPGPSELELAQQRARAAEREAQYAAGMGGAADIISGTRYNTHAGEDIRAAGQQGVKDVLDREAQGLRAAGEGRAVEDQTFQRQGEQRAAGADQRAQQGFATQQGEFDATSTRSKGARANLVARYPHIAKRIPPEQFATMTEHDVKMLMGELPETAGKGAGAKGPKGMTANQLAKLVPENALDTHRTGAMIDADVQAMGGWDKLAAGFVEGVTPPALLQQTEQRIRQNLSKMLGSYRKSIAGTAVTPQENENVERVASVIKFGKTIGELKNGLEILRSLNVNRVEQAIGLQSPEVIEGVRGMFNAKPGSILKLEQAGGSGNAPPPPADDTVLGKDGKRYRLFPDGSAEAVE